MARMYEDSYVWIPSVTEESVNGTRDISLQTSHFAKRRIFLTGEITNRIADDFVQEMLFLAEKSNIRSHEPVDIFIDSPGGSVYAGLVIYDVIQACKEKIDINIYCVGMAASMAAIILAGGAKGHRFILPHSRCMIHEPLISGGLGGSTTSIKKTAEALLSVREITNQIIAKHTGRTIEEVNEATSFDNEMTAEEAVAFGLCDEIRNII